LAYIQRWNPLDDQTETTGQTTGINPTITQGSQTTDTGGGSDPNAQKQDGNFHNLQKYLAANQPGATALGGQVAGDINQAGQTAQTAIDTATNDFTGAVNAGTNIFNPDAGDVSQSQQSTYTGPTNFNNSEQGIAATDAVTKANEKAMLGSTVGGRTQMLQEGGPQDMTRGSANLDQFLLQNTMPAYNQVATAANNMAPLTDQFNTQSTTNQGLVTTAQKNVSDKNAALQTLIDKQTTDQAAAKIAADKAANQAEIDTKAATLKAANDAYLAQLAAANNTQQTQFEQQQATNNTANETAYQKMVDLINSYKASTAAPVTTTPPAATDTTTPAVVAGLVTLADGRQYDPTTGIITGSATSSTNTGGGVSTGTNTGTQGEGGMGPGSSVSGGAPSGTSVGAPSVGLTGSQIANIALSVVAPTAMNIGKTIAAIVSNVQANNAVAQAVADSNPATNGSISNSPTAVSAADAANGVVGVTGGTAAAAGAAAAAAAAAAGVSDTAIGAAAQAASDATVAGASPAAAAAAGAAASDAANSVSTSDNTSSDAVGAAGDTPAGDVGLSSGNTGDNASASVSSSPGDAVGDSPGSVSVGASEGQTGSVSEGGGEGGGGKIICTAMNDLYGLPYTENKVWVKYAVTHLKPEHQVGYHKVFLPLVDYAYKQGNGWSHLQVRKVLEYIAVNRTIDIQAELSGKYRRPVHKLLRNIIEPVLYWIGRK
jgi:hypothetical protein